MMHENMPEDPNGDVKEFFRQFREQVLPKMEESEFMLTGGNPQKFDPMFALQIGACVLMDKPLIFCISPGAEASEKLMKVADEIVEVDTKNLDAPGTQERMKEAIQRVADKTGLDLR